MRPKMMRKHLNELEGTRVVVVFNVYHVLLEIIVLLDPVEEFIALLISPSLQSEESCNRMSTSLYKSNK